MEARRAAGRQVPPLVERRVTGSEDSGGAKSPSVAETFEDFERVPGRNPAGASTARSADLDILPRFL
jgi:hypothetical protein